MAITNIIKSITLDVYDHDKASKTIKSITADNDTRYIAAEIQCEGVQYDIGQSAVVELIILRPDKVGVGITGSPYAFSYGGETPGEITTYYGVYAELDQVALAKTGTLLGQFKITSGEQILRTEIFKVNNGRALDTETSDWAGEYQGYNLDELVQNVNTAVGKVDAMEQDVSELKSGLTLIAEKSLSPTWESGNISTSTGREGTNASYIRTKAIDARLLANAKVTVSEDSNFKYGVYIFRYYSDGSFDSKISSVLNKGDTFSLPVNNAEYVRYVARRSPISADISVDVDSANLSLTAMVSVTKNMFAPYTAEHIRFSVTVNTQFSTDGDGTGTLDGETMQDIPCILRLPSNYDPSGAPVPLIMFSHGTGTSVTDDSTTGQIDNYFTYVGDSECAVFDCNGMVVGSGTVEGMNLGSPIAVQAFHKAYEYIIRHYNVRKDLIVGGNSQGGLAALNFVNSYPNIVRCIVLAYPVTSLKEQAWDDPWRSEVKPAVASVFNFSDTTGETWEADKVVGYDPINNRAVTVGDEHCVFLPVPIKIWHGSADTVVAYQGSVNYINSVKSAGIPAYLRTISGGTHGAASVTNAFYREAKYFIRRFL